MYAFSQRHTNTHTYTNVHTNRTLSWCFSQQHPPLGSWELYGRDWFRLLAEMCRKRKQLDTNTRRTAGKPATATGRWQWDEKYTETIYHQCQHLNREPWWPSVFVWLVPWRITAVCLTVFHISFTVTWSWYEQQRASAVLYKNAPIACQPKNKRFNFLVFHEGMEETRETERKHRFEMAVPVRCSCTGCGRRENI